MPIAYGHRMSTQLSRQNQIIYNFSFATVNIENMKGAPVVLTAMKSLFGRLTNAQGFE